MTRNGWRVRLGPTAERDFRNILQWTVDAFGDRQAQRYRYILVAALINLREGPYVPGSSPRDEIVPGLRTLHVGPPGRHFLVYRPAGANTIQVLRILHDAMDLARHVPQDDPGAEESPTKE